MTVAQQCQLGVAVSPSRGERFGRVPDRVLEDLELSDGDVRVYAFLARWGNWSTGESDDARSSHQRIAVGTGRSVSSVKRSLGRLAERGHVEVIPMVSVYGDRAANRYRLVALDPRESILRSVPGPVEEPVVEGESLEVGGGISGDPTPGHGWPSKEPEFFSEQDTPLTPPTETTAPAGEARAEDGGDDHHEPEPARDLPGEAAEVLDGFRRVVPEARREVFDRQAAGPGGRRLVAAAGGWVGAGGSLERLVEAAARGPLPELVHNWPAFLAARVEALEPPRQDVVDHDAHPDNDDVVMIETERRRAADEAAAAGHAAVVGEAAAVSAALGEHVLAAVVDRVGEGLPGLLGRSPMAVSRAVVGFCRAACATRPGDLETAVAATLAAATPLPAEPENGWPAVPLPAPPMGTPGLQDRIRTLIRPTVGPLAGPD